MEIKIDDKELLVKETTTATIQGISISFIRQEEGG